jgi:hypothetical protein
MKVTVQIFDFILDRSAGQTPTILRLEFETRFSLLSGVGFDRMGLVQDDPEPFFLK